MQETVKAGPGRGALEQGARDEQREANGHAQGDELRAAEAAARQGRGVARGAGILVPALQQARQEQQQESRQGQLAPGKGRKRSHQHPDRSDEKRREQPAEEQRLEHGRLARGHAPQKRRGVEQEREPEQRSPRAGSSEQLVQHEPQGTRAEQETPRAAGLSSGLAQ